MSRPPSIRATFEAALRPNEIAIDNFAGGGGASTGIEAAIGRPVDIAINHSPQAIAMHQANHPETRHFCENILEVDPVEACGSRPVGLAWFSPDCFPAGTLVLTREGYRAIEQIAVGDEVLTHECRWRRVTATMSTVRPLLRLRGHGHPGLTVSAEHPILARHRSDVWNNERRRYQRTLGPEDWVPASALDRGWYWATPTQFPEAQAPSIPVYRGRTLGITPELMWLVGRYIADGWTRLTDTRAELVITCGRHEVVGLAERLFFWPRVGTRAGAEEIAWHERETGTAYQFTADHRGLVEWLRAHFGHGAAEKLIPGWALGMPRELREALLAGYMSGDGHRNEHQGTPLYEATTVSKALAFGLRSLAASLGKTVAVYVGPNRNVIEGRTVNALPAWKVKWRDEVASDHRQTFRGESLEWSAIREQEDSGVSAEVFNLSVEDDESYVAEGVVVHNCTHFSRAKGTAPVSKEIRGLAWVVTRWAKAVRPRVIVLENVEEFQTWGPLGEDMRPDPARAGETFRAWLAELAGCGYSIEFKPLVAADYGTPTTRKRLFLVARRDGAGISWPDATHGKGRAHAWRPAADVIDWSLACPSIFGRKRPLAEATLARIAAGIRRYVVGSAQPFILPLTHQGDRRVHSIDEPVRTITGANRGELALAQPFIVRHGHYSTITGAGLREGCGAGTFRGQPLESPLATVCATNDKHIVCPIVTKHYGGMVGHGVEQTLGTVTSKDHHALTAAFLTKFYGKSVGAPLVEPMPTLSGHAHLGEVRAFLTKFYGTAVGADLQMPLPTVTAGGHHLGLVTIHGEQWQIVDIGMRMLQPHELFAAQGFPDSYRINAPFNGRTLNKTEQTALAGNSVCPQVAEAIVAENVRGRRVAA
jgi:site-specific DNA-cytosine methylase